MLSEVPGLHHFDAYLDAFAELNSSEIAAAVLALGVLLFAVVTAIMLVRMRLRASAAEAASRDEITVYKAMGHVMEDIVAATQVYERTKITLDDFALYR